MVGAIVLAAGAATRMGQQKLLLPFAGKTVIEHVVSELRRAEIAQIIVVTGSDSERVEAALANSGATCAHNPDYTRGMLSSVRMGISAAPDSWRAAIVALGDQPLITADIVQRVRDAQTDSPDNIIVPIFEGRRGHPMGLPRTFWEESRTRYDTVGLRGVLRANANKVLEIAAHSGDVLTDIDTPQDYQDALARLAERSCDSAT
jgi:molybdenum cofactor cytidylyltransferase